MEVVVVEPLGNAWAVSFAGSEPTLYRTGQQAEEAAKLVAMRLANTGRHVELRIKVRTGETAARFVCIPPISEGDRAILTGGLLPDTPTAWSADPVSTHGLARVVQPQERHPQACR